jgi:Rhs element Vgr protein
VPATTVTITSEGEVLDSSIAVISIEVRKQLDRIPEARLVLLDGSVAAREFELSNAAAFELGNKVAVDLRYEGDEDVQVFEGLVVRHAVEANPSGLELRVELKDAAIKLTRPRKSAVFKQALDSDVIAKLIEGAGLTVGTIEPTKVTHKELIQHYASDWDFLLSRADVNGQVVIVDDGTISVRAMTADDPTKLELEFGLDDILDLELELDGSTQWSDITSQAWDVAQRAFADPVAAEALEVTAGNLEAAAVASKLGADSYALLLPAGLAPDELAPWASARLARSRLSMFRGRVVIPGRGDVRPFDRIELGGVSERFNGKLLVAGVIQRLDHEGWSTELEIGLAPEWFARTPDIADVPAGGLLPPVLGLQLGIVDAFEADPDGEQRIRVRLPALAGEQTPVWARMAWPDAGKDRGFVFWPEIDDEVVLGFLAGDPRQAVVLGSLYGSVATPPPAAAGPSSDNFKRAIVSKAGTTISFDDEKASLTIETSKKNTIVVNDDAEAITISDQHGNKITMDKDGIKLVSAADFAIEASGNVKIKGSAVDIQ